MIAAAADDAVDQSIPVAAVAGAGASWHCASASAVQPLCPLRSRRYLSSSISTSALTCSISHNRGSAFRCQEPGQRIGWQIGLLEGSPPTSRGARSRACLSAASALAVAGRASRQCRCNLFSGVLPPLIHVPPLLTTTVAGPSRPSRIVRASPGCWSHSTLSARPSRDPAPVHGPYCRRPQAADKRRRLRVLRRPPGVVLGYVDEKPQPSRKICGA